MNHSILIISALMITSVPLASGQGERDSPSDDGVYRTRTGKKISDFQFSTSSEQRDYAIVRNYYAKLVSNMDNPPEKIQDYLQFQELIHRRLSERFKPLRFSVLIEYKGSEAIAKISRSTGVVGSDKMILQFIKDLKVQIPQSFVRENIILLVGP